MVRLNQSVNNNRLEVLAETSRNSCAYFSQTFYLIQLILSSLSVHVLITSSAPENCLTPVNL